MKSLSVLVLLCILALALYGRVEARIRSAYAAGGTDCTIIVTGGPNQRYDCWLINANDGQYGPYVGYCAVAVNDGSMCNSSQAGDVCYARPFIPFQDRR
jgi:hypothetical protein